jgi:hypothetical protein
MNDELEFGRTEALCQHFLEETEGHTEIFQAG